MSCENCHRKCCVFGNGSVIFLSFIFHMMLIFIMELSLDYGEIKEIIFGETPIYKLYFDNNPHAGKNYIKSFHEFKGREIIETTSGKNANNRKIYGKKNITKIYQKYFIYDKDDKTYFDYYKDFTVALGESCKENYKKCGIFNSENRILCLPNGQNCPLNDFAISNIKNDPNYDGYQQFEVLDSEEVKHYFFYTNTKVNNPIITTFKLSYGFPCIDSSETSWISVFRNEVDLNPTCTTSINGNTLDYSYTQVVNGITLRSLYIDNSIDITDANSEKISQTVNLYTRNFFTKNENCINKYLSDIKKENDKYHDIEKTVKILNIIDIFLLVFLFVYSNLILCINYLEFYLYFLIIHIYGIIQLIVSIVLVYRKKLDYKCDGDIGLNKKINEILYKNNDNNRSFVMAMCILSIILIILSIIFSICIHKKKKEINSSHLTPYNGYGPGVLIPLPVVNPIPQAIYIQPNQINNLGNNTPYVNFPQINNQLYQVPSNLVVPAYINNAPPPSA